MGILVWVMKIIATNYFRYQYRVQRQGHHHSVNVTTPWSLRTSVQRHLETFPTDFKFLRRIGLQPLLHKQNFCQVPLFQPGARCTRPQCAAVLDIYGDHLLYCERGSHRIRRHDAQVRLLAGDLANAARHPIVEERPLGRHRERPDIRALGRRGGTDLFDVTICHPLCQARIRDSVRNPLNILKAAWAGKVSSGPRSRKKRATVTSSDRHTWWMASGRPSCPVLSGNNNCRSWNVHFQLC